MTSDAPHGVYRADWIVTHLRAALAALSVPNFSAGWPLEEDDGSIIVGATKPAKDS